MTYDPHPSEHAPARRKVHVIVWATLSFCATLCGWGPGLTLIYLAQGRSALPKPVEGSHSGSDAQFAAFVVQGGLSTVLWLALGGLSIAYIASRDRVLRVLGGIGIVLFLTLLFWGLSEMRRPMEIIS